MPPPTPAPASPAVPSPTLNTLHPPLRCGKFKSLLADPASRQQRRDEALKRKASDTAPNVPNQKPCLSKPGCGSQIEKTTGCDHMTCNCEFEFCYVCRAPYAGPQGIRMIMARKNKNNPRIPPWVTARPYFKHAAQAFKDAHRPHWNPKTIWVGDPLTRDYYSARKGIDKLYGLPPGRDIIPQNPYNEEDIAYARANKTLPLRRDARGNPIPPVPAAPPLHPPRPKNNYPYDFWPQEPWHPDPYDPARDITMEFLAENTYIFLETAPNQWPVRDESDMRGAKWLGQGAYGCAGLWCQVNPTYVIERRFVIKEARMTKGDWRDPIKWRDQVPQEIRVHQLVDSNRANAVGDHDTIIEHYGYRLMMRQRRYRIYLAYYEGGDLHSALRGRMPDPELVELYTSPRKSETKVRAGYSWDAELRCYKDPEDNLPPVIPERLILEIIDSLAKACQILHFGQVNYEVVAAGAKRITHRDIKPDNIFIKPSFEFEEFPKFVLGDLGLSFFSHDRDEDNGVAHGSRAPPDNPDQYAWSHEQFDHRYAPEVYEKTQETHPHPIGEKTDVWQIGAVLFWLLTNGFEHSSRGPKALLYDIPTYISRAERFPRIERYDGTDMFDDELYPTLLRYAPALRNLYARCVNWDPDHRPGLQDVREDLQLILNADPEMSADRTYGPLLMRMENDFIVGALFPFYPQGGL
ncbi:hypothetical protein COCSADRAFT_31102 [Bipolaris sorokiniana ND90Pr]|uniref:non-specific serine/threonine protein kinase n=1 Tax=Cochliobolus sativus (strain ND90Pr / ATCC 201652) TaxID=665912 RepID=M2S8P5_COCSN|nr:uncharacterized protein COCSADRAFT_31102 [Bipolaris sorokiniana ND90Pr]EMD58950.1 hypothetical protein COCSADRAFT_31102 [Bipolaris sorokiniana ND90Pr]